MIDEVSEELAPGIFQNWSQGRQLVIFTIANVTRESVDAYIHANLRVIYTWPPDQPFLLLQELAPGRPITPYLRRRSLELDHIADHMGMHGRFAVVIPCGMVHNTAQLILRSTSISNIERQAFATRQDALDWLLQY